MKSILDPLKHRLVMIFYPRKVKERYFTRLRDQTSIRLQSLITDIEERKRQNNALRYRIKLLQGEKRAKQN